MLKMTVTGNTEFKANFFMNHLQNQLYDKTYLGMQLGEDFSTSHVAKSFIGTGLTPIPAEGFTRSAAISVC